MNSYLQFASNQSSTDVPERLVLVLDASPSMMGTDWKPSRMDGAKEATIELLKVKAEHYPNDLVGIVTFNQESRLIHPFARVRESFNELKESLSAIVFDNWTNITAGLEAAQALLEGRSSMEPIGARVRGWISKLFMEDAPSPTLVSSSSSGRIVVLSDGGHNTGPKPQPLASRLQGKYLIDVIGIGGSPEDVDEEKLMPIASKNPDGSPRYCFIGDKRELIRAFRKLGHHIKRIQ